jgi:hypothetical protein
MEIEGGDEKGENFDFENLVHSAFALLWRGKPRNLRLNEHRL